MKGPSLFLRFAHTRIEGDAHNGDQDCFPCSLVQARAHPIPDTFQVMLWEIQQNIFEDEHHNLPKTMDEKFILEKAPSADNKGDLLTTPRSSTTRWTSIKTGARRSSIPQSRRSRYGRTPRCATKQLCPALPGGTDWGATRRGRGRTRKNSPRSTFRRQRRKLFFRHRELSHRE